MRETNVPDKIIDNPNYISTRGYLANADKFNTNFFNYSAREAELMDPQHRLLLECAQETLESGDYDPEQYTNTIGIYTNANITTYGKNMIERVHTLDHVDLVLDTIGGALPDLVRIVNDDPRRVISITDKSNPTHNVHNNYNNNHPLHYKTFTELTQHTTNNTFNIPITRTLICVVS